MLYEYESELYPFGFEQRDSDWYKGTLLSLPTDKLLSEYNSLVVWLERLRKEEPPRKRAKQSSYKVWIKHVHDIQDLIGEVAEELESRDQK